MRKNPYIRILEAFDKGVGVQLSADEVAFMRFDSAIETAAVETISGGTISNGAADMDKHGIVRAALKAQDPSHD